MELVILVGWLVIALSGITVVIGAVTVGISIRQHRRDVHIREERPTMTAELFSQLSNDETDWEAWVTELSTVEQAAARSTIERLIRQLHGTERRNLERLAFALGVNQKKLQQDIKSHNRYRTLRALSWLAFVEYPSVVDCALKHCTWDRAVRSALARVLHETSDPRASRTGVNILIGEGTEPLSVFGLDTLYRIIQRDPLHLLNRARTEHSDWSDSVLRQVLIALRHCYSGMNPASIEWVSDCLDRDPEVQVEVLLLLGEYGWSSSFRDKVNITEFCLHPNPVIRQAAYSALGVWGGDELQSAVELVTEEPDDLARLVGVRSLHSHDYDEIDTASDQFTRTRQWVLAQNQSVREVS